MDIKAIGKKIENAIDTAIQNYIEKLADAGEKTIATAIANGSYQDRTGDLRDSIGYLVAYNGKSIRSNFTNTRAGEEAREKANRKVIGTNGALLIVIAGESYASYVESQGFDVLTSASQMASKLIPQLLK